MKILLLGKEGQVGWQLQRSLAPHGQVVACGRDECDLSDLDQLRRLIRQLAPSVIVNAAAYTAVDDAETASALALRINAQAPGVMADEAARLDALLIHYSTDYVFDGTKTAPYVESDNPAPLNVYGQSKLLGEQAIAAAQCRAVILRTSAVFGARGDNFVKTILRLAREKNAINVVDDQWGNPTPAALIATVSGVVLGVLRQSQQLAPGTQRIYHLAAANPFSWYGFAQVIIGMAASMPGFNLRLTADNIQPIPSDQYPTPARRPKNSQLDCTRLETDFGLQMPDWQPYLGRMLQLLSLKQNGY